MYIVLPLFLAYLYIGQSFHYLTPFFKKFYSSM